MKLMEMYHTKFITAINWKRNTRKKINLSCDALSWEKKFKKMLLHCYAIKKHGVKILRCEENVVCLSKVCLDSGYLKFKWLGYKEKARHYVPPNGSTPHHL